MYGKLAAGLLTLGIAMSTTMSTPAHAAFQEKTATSFQGGCSIKTPTHRSKRTPTGGPAPMSYTLSDCMISTRHVISCALI
jgi:hypothetical protein